MQLRFQGLYHFPQLHGREMAESLCQHFKANGIEAESRQITSVFNSQKYRSSSSYGDAFNPFPGEDTFLNGINSHTMVVGTGSQLRKDLANDERERAVYQDWLDTTKAQQWPTQSPPSDYTHTAPSGCR